MKTINKKMIFTASILWVVSLFTFSCSDDFLRQEAIGSYPESTIHTPDGVNKLLIGAYSLLNGTGGLATGPGQILFGTIRGGEGHKGSSTGDQPQMIDIQKFEVTAVNSSNETFFRWFYNAIYRCNEVLKALPKIENDMSVEEYSKMEAEAKFLRGHYYFMLKRLYDNVPWIDELTVDYRVPNKDESGNYIDIWSKIQADFDFARKNLPENQPDFGRPNKWAGEAYYAKLRLYMGNAGETGAYEEALTIFNDVIDNGKNNALESYSLYENYHYNFNADTENGVEWIWGVQHSVNDGTTGINPANGSVDMQYISTQSGDGPGLGRGYGFFSPTQWFVDHFRTDENGLPYLNGYDTNPNSVKSDDGISATESFTPDHVPLDPRLDWSVGRRGIPFLDYGVMPGSSWLRDPVASGPYLSKKFFTLKKDDGKYTAGGAFNALNIAVIRFADVLLMAAELEARVGSLDRARELVNTVRERMTKNTESAENWVKNDNGIDAANYKIGLYPTESGAFSSRDKALQAILYERLLELGLEGHRAYDVVRFGQADGGLTDTREFNDFLEFESQSRGYLRGGKYSVVPDRFMPIPQTAIENSFLAGDYTLSQNPGY